MAIFFVDVTPNNFLLPIGGWLACQGEVCHNNEVYKGEFNFGLNGGIVLHGEERVELLPSTVEKASGNTTYEDKPIKITWIRAERKFIVERD